MKQGQVDLLAAQNVKSSVEDGDQSRCESKIHFTLGQCYRSKSNQLAHAGPRLQVAENSPVVAYNPLFI